MIPNQAIFKCLTLVCKADLYRSKKEIRKGDKFNHGDLYNIQRKKIMLPTDNFKCDICHMNHTITEIMDHDNWWA